MIFFLTATNGIHRIGSCEPQYFHCYFAEQVTIGHVILYNRESEDGYTVRLANRLGKARVLGVVVDDAHHYISATFHDQGPLNKAELCVNEYVTVVLKRSASDVRRIRAISEADLK